MPCKGYMCVAQVYDKSGYCPNCKLLRDQHDASHRLEGHSHEYITMCPGCEFEEEMGKDMA